jgi:hypothetical protein
VHSAECPDVPRVPAFALIFVGVEITVEARVHRHGMA